MKHRDDGTRRQGRSGTTRRERNELRTLLLEVRYFLIQDARPGSIKQLLERHNLSGADTVYVKPADGVDIKTIRKEAPKGCTVFDLRLYDTTLIKQNAVMLGYPVIEV